MLPGERLHDAHAGDALGEVGVDDADRAAGGAVGIDRPPPPVDHHRGHDREDAEGKQGELPVGDQHDDHDADQDEEIGDDAGDAVREQLVDDADVVLDPGHDRADAALVQVADAQRLEVAEHRVAQVEDDPVADPGGEVELAPHREEANDEGEDERDSDDVERP